MRALLDVNVLLPLLDPLHVVHSNTIHWLATNLSAGWVSCPFTENACLRLLTSPRYSCPQTPEQVLTALNMLRSSGHHTFLPADLSIVDTAIFDWGQLQGHHQITDVYLLARSGAWRTAGDIRPTHPDRDGERMPPASSGKTLNPASNRFFGT